MTRDLLEIRKEEAFYHATHYHHYTIDSLDSWLGYPVQKLVELGVAISASNQFASFLDLGCGVGRNAIPIVRSASSPNLQIDCVDLLPEAIQHFSRYAQENELANHFNFHVADAAEFNLSHKKYDYIFSVSTLEHLENRHQFTEVLKAIEHATKSDGYVYFVINSEVSEGLISNRTQISPFVEINRSSSDINTILNEVFKNWLVIETEIKQLTFEIERSFGNTEMKTKAITFVAQKKS